MKKRLFTACLLLSTLFFGYQNFSLAGDFYKNNFESGVMPLVDTPDPIWKLQSRFSKTYGPGNFFEVTDSTSHDGNYSLRITYEGQNGICNTCGGYGFSQKTGLNRASTFVADDGSDLSIADDPATSRPNDGPNAQPGRLVYNIDNGYSLWEIQTIENENTLNDKLSLKLLRPGINGETPEFNGGDIVSIRKACGVDGIVGNQIDRRSDCDALIHWFRDVQEQVPGTSIFRRLYLKQEITTHFPLHQKLHYFSPNSDGSRGSVKGLLLLMGIADRQHKSLGSPFPQSGLRHYGGNVYYEPGNGMPPDTKFERSTWYYIEIEAKSSTFNTTTGEYNLDGEYRLWFAKSGEETDTPIVEEKGLQLPALAAGGGSTSLWGNNQHAMNDFGSWYMDDLVISDTRVGWISNPVGNNTAPPASPLTK